MKRWFSYGVGLTLLVTAGCGTGPIGPDGFRPGSEQPQAGAQVSLEAELAALPTPAHANPLIFEQLKSAFKQVLAYNSTVRGTSAVTTASQSMVNDLEVVPFDTGGGVDLFWSYRNAGDSNQDGEANISDLALLGQHFQKTFSAPDWATAQMADSNGDGEVNVADLSPLGGNLGGQVQGYKVFGTSDPGTASSWQELADLPLDDGDPAPGSARLHFSASLTGVDPDQFFRVTPYVGSQLGIAGPPVGSGDIPAIVGSVSPLSGAAGAQVTFSAVVYGAEPITYSWDFGGGATPNTSTAKSPSVTLANGGSFNGTLNVSNPNGASDFDFTFSISSNSAPSAVIVANPAAGAAPLVVSFDGSGSDDSDGNIVKYEWDWDGNNVYDLDTQGTASAEHTYSGTGSYTARLRVTDDGGLTATDEVSITLANPPVAALEAAIPSGAAPLSTRLNAGTSTSPNGKIVKFEWDYDGNGTWDAETTSPFYSAVLDGPVGTYNAKVRITDESGATAEATTPLTITSVTFVAPPIEQFASLAPAAATAKQKFLKNCYSTLPAWNDANGPYQSTFFAGWADQVFALVNAKRVAAGAPAVKRDRHMDLVIQAHVRDEALRSYFAHSNADGLGSQDRVNAVSPPNWDWSGEILGLGQESPQESADGWQNSPGHNAIMKDPVYTHAGVGIYYKTNGPTGLEAYWGMQFYSVLEDPDAHDWLEPAEVQ